MATNAEKVDVAVVGAGLVGAAMALGCAQLGLRVAWVGPVVAPFVPSAQAPFDSRIYALAPATIALLQRLRVWEAFNAARAQPVERMQIFGDTGAELVFDAYGATVERLATIVEESELARVLRLGCEFAPSLQRFEGALEQVQFLPQQAQLALADGRTLQASLVVAADGARSYVRAAAGISARDVPYGQTALVANFACEQWHRSTAYQWFSAHGVLALLPLPRSDAGANAVSLVWSAPESLAQELRALPAADLGQRVSEITSAPLGALRPLGAAAAFPLRRLTVAQKIALRLALIGDAAHVVHPLAGQGLNLGLQDVATLLDVLSARESFREVGDAVLLRRYARTRAEAVGLMQATTDGLTRVFASADPRLQRLRNLGLTLVNHAPPLKRLLVQHALG